MTVSIRCLYLSCVSVHFLGIALNRKSSVSFTRCRKGRRAWFFSEPSTEYIASFCVLHGQFRVQFKEVLNTLRSTMCHFLSISNVVPRTYVYRFLHSRISEMLIVRQTSLVLKETRLWANDDVVELTQSLNAGSACGARSRLSETRAHSNIMDQAFIDTLWFESPGL